MQSEVTSVLNSLGFSSKKSDIFIALLELGEATATEIAKKAKLKRTTVYNILPELIAEGHVKTEKKKKKTVFFVEDVRSLLTPLRLAEESVQRLLPHLQSMHNVLGFKPKVTAYEGEAGAVEFWLKTIDVPPGSVIYEMVGPESFYTKLPKVIADSYVTNRLKRKISIKIIASDSPISRELAQTAHKEMREIKIAPRKTWDAAMLIFGNKVGFISFSEDFRGVIIESETIAEMQRTTFEMLWEFLHQ